MAQLTGAFAYGRHSALGPMVLVVARRFTSAPVLITVPDLLTLKKHSNRLRGSAYLEQATSIEMSASDPKPTFEPGRLGWLHQPSIRWRQRKRWVDEANQAYGPIHFGGGRQKSVSDPSRTFNLVGVISIDG